MSTFRQLDPFTMLSPVPAVMVSCRDTAPDAKHNIITIFNNAGIRSNISNYFFIVT